MIQVSTTSVDATLWEIKEKLFKRHTLAEANQIVSPLTWYISTARASTDFLRILINTTERQKSTIARRLEKSGTCEEAIDSVCNYLKYERLLEERNMKKYYADIYHAKSDTHITIGEYSENALERSIHACIKQRGFKEEDCVWQTRVENL